MAEHRPSKAAMRVRSPFLAPIRGDSMEQQEKKQEALIDGPIEIMAPICGSCPVCAAFHDENTPHNHHSLLYMTRFHWEYGRYPTPKDAAAHLQKNEVVT